MDVDLSIVKELRQKTGAGIMAVKKALDESGGNSDKAEEILKEQGLANALKKSGRDTSQGVIQSYIHAGNKIGALVELKCETDFVARTDDFINLAKDLAMQVAAMGPLFISKDDEGADKASEEEILMSQDFIKDPSVTIEDMIKSMISKVGENVNISRITKFDLS
ncbi:MAG: elongation factor Ts [Dehalococcoidia bacterium]|jgi:elongation factor Ts|nr:elongation factor Ts [Rickettsiales bacterium]MBN32720.1 elongation factor Ts [Dehalococcoidia bacterium]|tara:strand:+ start:9996 stop:10490 length:495 start_codon:yes stop_codon:yes gene_type:complete